MKLLAVGGERKKSKHSSQRAKRLHQVRGKLKDLAFGIEEEKEKKGEEIVG